MDEAGDQAALALFNRAQLKLADQHHLAIHRQQVFF
jgi:hypothetical protein